MFCFCRCCFIGVFAVLINKVSLQETVETVIGGSVLLPCSSTEHDLKLQDTDVHWRDNKDKIVYSIIKGKDSVAGQDPEYKNRAETFPEEYKRGNFCLKLINLTHADARKYICYITHPSYSKQETVELVIIVLHCSNVVFFFTFCSTEQENQGEDTGEDSVRTSSQWTYIVSTVLFIVIIVFFFFIYRKRRICPFFSFSTEEQRTATEMTSVV
ncbi:hypothetical protein PO909_027086 [Leuciscus waleckii]